jgi:tetratricopeptide (TPR) repeat protein
MRGRYPKDPSLELAWGVYVEAGFRTLMDTWGVAGMRSGHPINEAPFDAERRLDSAAKAFTIARTDPVNWAEATVRLGSVLVSGGERQQALDLWREVVARTDDSLVRYLAYLFQGRALSELDRKQEAIASYRRALAEKPGAQSAVVGLAVLLFLTDSRAEAALLIRSQFDRDEAPDDPYWSYLAPGIHEWPGRLGALRAALANARR